MHKQDPGHTFLSTTNGPCNTATQPRTSGKDRSSLRHLTRFQPMQSS